MNVALGEEEVGGVLGVDVGDAVLVAVVAIPWATFLPAGGV